MDGSEKRLVRIKVAAVLRHSETRSNRKLVIVRVFDRHNAGWAEWR
jgi:hypothetical protein